MNSIRKHPTYMRKFQIGGHRVSFVHLSDKICVYILPYEQQKVNLNLFAIPSCGLSRFFSKRRLNTFFAISKKKIFTVHVRLESFSLFLLIDDEQIFNLKIFSNFKAILTIRRRWLSREWEKSYFGIQTTTCFVK